MASMILPSICGIADLLDYLQSPKSFHSLNYAQHFSFTFRLSRNSLRSSGGICVSKRRI